MSFVDLHQWMGNIDSYFQNLFQAKLLQFKSSLTPQNSWTVWETLKYAQN